MVLNTRNYQLPETILRGGSNISSSVEHTGRKEKVGGSMLIKSSTTDPTRHPNEHAPPGCHV